jgi:hypothetical protein
MQWTIFKTTNALSQSGNAFIKGYTMKTFVVELKRTSYVNLTIEADSQDEAEALAWAEIESGESYGISNDADWNLNHIEELTEDPETETGEDLAQFYGPSVRI